MKEFKNGFPEIIINSRPLIGTNCNSRTSSRVEIRTYARSDLKKLFFSRHSANPYERTLISKRWL